MPERDPRVGQVLRNGFYLCEITSIEYPGYAKGFSDQRMIGITALEAFGRKVESDRPTIFNGEEYERWAATATVVRWGDQ